MPSREPSPTDPGREGEASDLKVADAPPQASGPGIPRAWRAFRQAPSAVWHVVDTRLQLRHLLGRLEVSSPQNVALFALSLFAALALYLGLGTVVELSEAARRAGFILALATGLWVTEASPAFAVGILVIALDVLLLAPTAGEPDTAWLESIGVLGHPLVWLFFGGFVLAAGTERSHLDRTLARVALSRFGTRPAAVLAGVMCVTFGFSAFMSNTATTALMLALLAPLLATLTPAEPFRKSLLLGTAAAANLGGMASLIGTPPNAIAAGLLSELPSQRVDFVSWMAIGLPLASCLSIGSWLLLMRLYPTDLRSIDCAAAWSKEGVGDRQIPAWKRLVVGATGLFTVGLWMTSGLHGAPIAVVSLLPIVVFTTLSVLSPTEIRGLPWDVLFLLAGGLTLGRMVMDSGLAAWLVTLLPTQALGPVGIAVLVAYACTVLSNFMSNTAAANILLPLGVGLVPGAEAQVALPVALAASMAMSLPIATPPNALVFSTGGLATKDFLRLGLLLGAVAPLLAVVWVWLVS